MDDPFLHTLKFSPPMLAALLFGRNFHLAVREAHSIHPRDYIATAGAGHWTRRGPAIRPTRAPERDLHRSWRVNPGKPYSDSQLTTSVAFMPRKGGSMFVELMPLLAGRTVLITVAKVDDKVVRVNVIRSEEHTSELQSP